MELLAGATTIEMLEPVRFFGEVHPAGSRRVVPIAVARALVDVQKVAVEIQGDGSRRRPRGRPRKPKAAKADQAGL